MTRDEILKLHELSDEEQAEWLFLNDILKYTQGYSYYRNDYPSVYPIHESLADCAFRLRDEFIAKEPMNRVKYKMAFHSLGVDFFTAKPIHWIQSALLAKSEKGETE